MLAVFFLLYTIFKTSNNMTYPKSKPIALLAAGLLSFGFCQAQDSANASGGDATGSGGTVAYSVGQVAYTYNTGSTGNIEQGVQHAYEIITLGTPETELNMALTAYPNPATDNLTLQISNYNKEKLSYQLYDIQGKQLGNGQIVAEQTQINMNNLPTAMYFVNVINQKNKIIQSFKIVKNK